MKTRLRKLWDTLRSTYWFVPLVMMALTFTLWTITSTIDYKIFSTRTVPISWLYFDDVDSVRSLVMTIAGAIIGTVGVVFSIIMVPLTITASQFGPRLLRTFLRDTGTQITLGTFTSTFIFCILVLLQLRNITTQHLPQISATIALAFGVLSFGILIYFINHVAVSVQASVVVAHVSKEIYTALIRDFPDTLDTENTGSASSHTDGETEILLDTKGIARTVTATKSGYVQARDDKQLLRIATEHDLIIQLLDHPGDFIVKNAPLANIWQATEKSNKVDEEINSAYMLGFQRTLIQDLVFGINELVEVAIRALSPAINDPFTAMTCLDWLGTILCEMCTRAFPHAAISDNDGSLRLITSPVTFTNLTDAAFNQIREYGRSSASVTQRLVNIIAVVAQCVHTDEQRAALQHHAMLVERGCHIGLPEKADREGITATYKTILELLRKNEAVK